jgi:hypothetical protein
MPRDSSGPLSEWPRALHLQGGADDNPDWPKEMWPKRDDGGLRMFTNPLDLHDLLVELDKAQG